MMTFLSLVVAALVLLLEGWLLFVVISRTWGERVLGWMLGYPLGVFLNALLFYVLTVAHIPLSLLSVTIAHALALIGLLFFAWRIPSKESLLPRAAEETGRSRILIAACVALLAVLAVVSIVHALTIPTFYWDAFTNWAMRSKLSFLAGDLALIEGVTQPQYPILLHGLQMLPMFGASWVDALTNVMTLLLSLSGFGSLFVLLRRMHGLQTALVALTLTLGMPLAIIHLRQGYADIHLSLYVLLSAAFLTIAARTHDRRALLFSAMFVAAGAWTKYEGLYAGVAVWVVLLLFLAWQKKQWRRTLVWGILPALFLTVLWPLFVMLRGMPISPHGISTAWHLDLFPLFLHRLFAMGMFGIHWWAIAAVLIACIIKEYGRLRTLCVEHPGILWGLGTVLFFLYTYLFTAEAKGLIQNDNFSRSLLMPTMLMTVSLTLLCAQIVSRMPSSKGDQSPPLP